MSTNNAKAFGSHLAATKILLVGNKEKPFNEYLLPKKTSSFYFGIEYDIQFV